MTRKDSVIIVGGGIAGLSCAIALTHAGLPFRLLESRGTIGGRIQTDRVGGFLCDRGFQILLTAYPEAARLLDYKALDLRPFYPGALVWVDGAFHRVADPFRRPLDALRSMRSPIGSLADKARILKLRRAALAGEIEELYLRPQTTTFSHLQSTGLSQAMIDRFFRPFLGGVFLEPDLATSSRKFEFVFRMFAVGDNAVPARGMGAIPEQLASRLPREQVRLLTRVETIQPGEVVLATGETLRAAAIVLAADGAEAARLTRCIPAPAWNSVTCLYFASDEPPVREPVLVLNGTGKGPVNNLCVLSQVSPDYAPPGRSLISVTVLRGAGLADAQLVAAVLDHVREWFGSSVFKWRHLKTYRIPQAIPAQPPEALQPVERPCQIEPGVFVCSDHRHMASINGAP
ncbi:MAG: NAD(P)/FAD-dependent oxidoreductase [Phycisphaerae bacterium]|nr:NAD(P)/FAD-dependent oxidoreductase [Phycisphaerae bacterium]